VEGDWDPVEAVKTIVIAGIAEKIRRQYTTQLEAAEALAIDQGMVSRLCSGKTERFSLPWLVQMADKLGADINITVT
jgi:predicted XRE-type DNA-binding protein